MPIMAPKVAFPAAFGILIGTCLFKILISDEELPILKGELQLYRNHYLYAEVAAHIVNASSAGTWFTSRYFKRLRWFW